MYSQLVIVLALSVAGTLSLPSALPTKVCAPEQWSGDLVGAISQVVDGNVMYLSARGYTATDYMGQKELIIQNVTDSETGKMYRAWQVTDFKQMKTYAINPEKKTCDMSPLPSSAKLTRHCVGDADLNFDGSLTIGGKEAFVYSTDSTWSNSTVSFTVWSDSFTVVSMIIQQVYSGIPQMIAYQVGNVSDAPLDPRMFELPSYCKSPSPTKRVCVPHQYESMALGQLGQVEQGKAMSYSLGMKTVRDFTNKMEAAVSNVSYEAGVIHTRTVTYWSEKKVYTINLDSKTCTITPTPVSHMEEFCSDSKNITWIASLEVGDKMADVYRYQLGSIKQVITAFRGTFEVISAITEQTFMNIPQMLALQFGNMTLGISDRNVFNIPDYCNKADTTVG